MSSLLHPAGQPMTRGVLRWLVIVARERCEMDCGRVATHTVKARCGCDSTMCKRHALWLENLWADGPRWHCVTCDACGIGSPIKAVSRR